MILPLPPATLAIGLAVVAVLLVLSAAVLRRGRCPAGYGLGLLLVVLLALAAAAKPPVGAAAAGLLLGGVATVLGLVLGEAAAAPLAALLAVAVARQAPATALSLALGMALGAWAAAFGALLPGLLRGRLADEPATDGTAVAALLSLGAIAAALGATRAARDSLALLPAGYLVALGVARLAALPLGRVARSGELVLAALLGAVACVLCGATAALWVVLVLGLLVAVLIEHLQPEASASAPAAWAAALGDGLLGALLVSAAAGVAFGLQRGFGLALAALAVARPLAGGLGRPLTYAQGALVALALLRLAGERYADAGRIDLYVQTVLVGLLVGLLAPLAVAAAAARYQALPDEAADRPWRRAELVGSGLLVLVLGPAVVGLLWGPASALAQIAAAAVAMVLLLAWRPLTAQLAAPVQHWLAALPLVYATAATVTAAVVPSTTRLALWSRPHKTVVLLVLAVALVLYLAVQRRSPGAPEAAGDAQ